MISAICEIVLFTHYLIVVYSQFRNPLLPIQRFFNQEYPIKQQQIEDYQVNQQFQMKKSAKL